LKHGQVPHLGGETEYGTQLTRPAGEDLEQRPTADGGEAMPAGNQLGAVGMTDLSRQCRKLSVIAPYDGSSASWR
jgi:hypothetical protein